MTKIGIVLLGIGAAIALGGGGVPQQGFLRLLDSYRKAKAKGEMPDMDATFANTTRKFYIIGMSIAMIGMFVLIIGFSLER